MACFPADTLDAARVVSRHARVAPVLAIVGGTQVRQLIIQAVAVDMIDLVFWISTSLKLPDDAMNEEIRTTNTNREVALPANRPPAGAPILIRWA